jgi:hypothetical protein
MEAKETSLECHPGSGKGVGEDTTFEPESLRGGDEEEDANGEEGEVTPPTHSLPPGDLPMLGDSVSKAVIFVGARQPKWP